MFVGALFVGGKVDAVHIITVEDAKHAIDAGWARYLDVLKGNRPLLYIHNLHFPVHLFGGYEIQGDCTWSALTNMVNCGIPADYKLKLSDFNALKEWYEEEEFVNIRGNRELRYPVPKQALGIHQTNAIYQPENSALPTFNFHIPVDMTKRRNLLKSLLLRVLVQ